MKRICLLPLLSGCVTLDALLPFHGNIPCTDVNEKTCEEQSDPWDKVCSSCDEYADPPWFTRDYEWRQTTLDDRDTIRPIETDYQDVSFETEDGTYSLNAWYLPSHGEDTTVANTLIVYNHGRFANIEHYNPRIRYLHEIGYAVFVWDYRGYGNSLPTSPGTAPSPPQTSDWMADARLAFQEALKVAPDPDKVVIYGMSVGGMPAGEMASTYDACAQVYEAAYNSISAKVETNTALSMPGSFFTSGLVENDLKLADSTIPALFLHGDREDRIHMDEAERLYKAIPDDTPKQFIVVEGAGHGLGGDFGGVPEQGIGAYERYLRDFFDNYAPGCIE